MPTAVELVDIDLALDRVFARTLTAVVVVAVGAVAVHKAPHSLVIEDIEVGAFDACVGHVSHVEVAHQVVAHRHAMAVGGKTDADARRVLGAVPQGGAHAVLYGGWNAGVGRQCVVPSLVYHAKSQGVIEFQRVNAGEVLSAGASRCKRHKQGE